MCEYRGVPVPLIVIGVIILIGIISVTVQQFSKPQINPFDYIQVSFQGETITIRAKAESALKLNLESKQITFMM